MGALLLGLELNIYHIKYVWLPFISGSGLGVGKILYCLDCKFLSQGICMCFSGGDRVFVLDSLVMQETVFQCTVRTVKNSINKIYSVLFNCMCCDLQEATCCLVGFIWNSQYVMQLLVTQYGGKFYLTCFIYI